jgi:hypothetical protein
VSSAISINIERCQCGAEVVLVPQGRLESAFGSVDLLLRFHRPVLVHEQNVDRTVSLNAPRCTTEWSTHSNIGHSVAIQVAQRNERATEFFRVGEASSKTPLCVTDFLAPLNGSILVHEQNMNCTAIRPPVVVARRSSRKVGRAVLVEVKQRAQRNTEVVAVAEDSGKAALSSCNFLETRHAQGIDARKQREEEHTENEHHGARACTRPQGKKKGAKIPESAISSKVARRKNDKKAVHFLCVTGMKESGEYEPPAETRTNPLEIHAPLAGLKRQPG